MTNKDFENIKICAYHESGHAILAYLVKWTVKSIKIELKKWQSFSWSYKL
jgi:ATP-dependent Zn protease